MINKYPYTDLHELNADWLLSKTAELEGKVKDLEDAPKGVTSVTPYYHSGTKIADYEQDGAEGEIYIPNNPAVLEKSAINRFDDGIDSYFKKIVSSIECVQTGSGIPSPSNPRPIYGFTDCTVTDVDNLDTPTETTTTTISFGAAGTVYGGYVDLISGKLVVDRGYKEYNGSEAWINVGGNYPQAFQLVDSSLGALQNDLRYLSTKNISNLYPWLAVDVASYGIRFQVSAIPSGRMFVYDDNYSSDLSGFLSHLQSTPLQICYLLATPQEYQLTPAQLRSLVGANRLTSSTGKVTEVEYITNETIAWLLDQIV